MKSPLIKGNSNHSSLTCRRVSDPMKTRRRGHVSAQVKGGRDVPINYYGLLSEESRALRAVSGSFLLNGDNQSNDMTPSGSRDPKKVSFFLPTSEDLGGYEKALFFS